MPAGTDPSAEPNGSSITNHWWESGRSFAGKPSVPDCATAMLDALAVDRSRATGSGSAREPKG